MARRFRRRAGRWRAFDEIHYFDSHYDRGPEWYTSHFSLPPWAKGSRSRVVFCEKTPKYLCDPRVPQRVKDVIPDAKLLVLLRNPVDRAYSQYRMNARRQGLTASFEEVLDAEFVRLESGGKKLLENDQLEACENKVWNNVLARGLYALQLERWMKHFRREQFLILKSEEMFEHPEVAYAQVLEHFGAGSRPLAPFERSESGHSPMAAELRQRLAEFFEPYNRALYSLLGRDLGWD
jgi:hypothetical protein